MREREAAKNKRLISLLNSDEDDDSPHAPKRSFVTFIGSGRTPLSPGSNLPNTPGPFTTSVIHDLAVKKMKTELKFVLANQMHQAHLDWQARMAAFMTETANRLESLEARMNTLIPPCTDLGKNNA